MGFSRIVRLILLILLAFPAPGNSGSKAVESFCPVVARGQMPAEESRTGKFTGYLLGGWSKEGWLESEAAAPLLRGGEKYRFYTLTGEAGVAAGSPSSPFADEEDPCHENTCGVLCRPSQGSGRPYGGGRFFQRPSQNTQDPEHGAAGL